MKLESANNTSCKNNSNIGMNISILYPSYEYLLIATASIGVAHCLTVSHFIRLQVVINLHLYKLL